MPHVRITNLAGSLDSTGPDAVLVQNRAFLVAFAHELVVNQALKASMVADHLAAPHGLSLRRPFEAGSGLGVRTPAFAPWSLVAKA
jgi:hypothetical protein